jgi:hypothetical protein
MENRKVWLRWDSRDWAYHGITSGGKKIRVDADEMAESCYDLGVDTGELSGMSRMADQIDEFPPKVITLLDPDVWEMCIGANQNVSYEDEPE